MVRGPFKMNVKSKCIVRGKEIYFETYFCKAPDAPKKHHIWSKLLWCVHLLWTQLWTNKTQHTDIFSILHQLTASLFRTWCTLLNMEAQQHLTHSYNFKINSRSHQCQSTVMKGQFTKKLKLHVSSYLFPRMRQVFSFRLQHKLTATMGWAPEPVTTWWQEVPPLGNQTHIQAL